MSCKCAYAHCKETEMLVTKVKKNIYDIRCLAKAWIFEIIFGSYNLFIGVKFYKYVSYNMNFLIFPFYRAFT